MSRPVDVLVVMDESIRRAEESGHIERSDRLQAARTAVAELIEVTNLALGWVNGPTKAEKAMRDRLRSALARVKGVA